MIVAPVWEARGKNINVNLRILISSGVFMGIVFEMFWESWNIILKGIMADLSLTSKLLATSTSQLSVKNPFGTTLAFLLTISWYTLESF